MYYDKLNSWKADNYAYDWDNKSPALHVLLTQIYPSEMMKCAFSAVCPCTLGTVMNAYLSAIQPSSYTVVRLMHTFDSRWKCRATTACCSLPLKTICT